MKKREVTREEFLQQRTLLLALLGDLQGCDLLSTENLKLFVDKSTKLREESFELVLVGEFQSGKSTTFNALCDGRDISPMGVGIKTSACKITARNCSDRSSSEYAVVTWKSDAEIAVVLRDYIEKRLESGKLESFDITNPDDYNLAQQAVEQEWKRYIERPDRYDSQQIDLLRIAMTILHFYRNPTIQEMRKDGTTTVPANTLTYNELKPYVIFPMDWVQRWNEKKSPEAFEINEILFTFVSKVDCYIHSPNLERLGCVIVDCPGLFAGPWDTMVAFEAMRHADAIVYLINGAKQIGFQDQYALEQIKASQQLHKLFVAMNAYVSYEHLEQVIRPTSGAVIRQTLGVDERSDFQLQDEDIWIYNAPMIFVAQWRACHDDQEQWSVYRKWISRIIRTVLDLDTDDEPEDRELLEKLKENPQAMLEASRYPRLFDAIESVVIRTKAAALLYDEGVVPVQNALALEIGQREAMIELAQRDQELVEQELTDATDTFQEYVQGVREVLGTTWQDQRYVDILADDYVRRVFEEEYHVLSKEIIYKISDLLDDPSTPFFRYICGVVSAKLGGQGVGEKELRQNLAHVINSSVEGFCERVTEGWVENLLSGQATVYDSTIGAARVRQAREQERIWKSLLERNPQLQRYFNGLLCDLDPASSDDIESEAHSFDGSVQADFAQESLTRNVGNNFVSAQLVRAISAFVVGMVVTVVTAALVVLICDFAVTFGLATVGGIIVAVLTGSKITEIVAGKFRSKLVNKLERELPEQLYSCIRSERESLLESAADLTRHILGVYQEYASDALDEQRQRFAERVENQRRAFEASMEERMAQVEKAQVEIKVLAPIKERCDELTQNIKLICYQE